MLSLGRIIHVVARHYGQPIDQIIGDRRRPDLVTSRHIVCYLARALTSASLHQIGRAVGRDHSTVLHAIASIEARMGSDQSLAADVTELTDRLKELLGDRTMINLLTSSDAGQIAQAVVDGDVLPDQLTFHNIMALAAAVIQAHRPLQIIWSEELPAPVPPEPSQPEPAPLDPVVVRFFEAQAALEAATYTRLEAKARLARDEAATALVSTLSRERGLSVPISHNPRGH
jgi:hypothetical protein